MRKNERKIEREKRETFAETFPSFAFQSATKELSRAQSYFPELSFGASKCRGEKIGSCKSGGNVVKAGKEGFIDANFVKPLHDYSLNVFGKFN
ncbi:hypothetical protein GWI33_019564 [Rhynchophorus ferrugineus]|uniref:Uncharacterized protein n=1 Tax=Rhynchophorus ferrugineus TaxID=354439 RepID=A0A834HTH3_RHYFE|nr:hypothetical protein GWI33_019564 [Rhynchophorus ferrugineus]